MSDSLKSAPWNAAIPENWERRSLKYCARMKGRLGWQNLRADEYTDEGPFLVTSEHFKDDHVEWNRCYHVTEERYAMAPEIQLRPQDVFFMKDGAAMGKLAYVDRLPGPACLNSHLLLFRPRHDEFTARFLYYILRSPLFQEFIATEATGTTFLGVSQESVGTFPLPLPPLPMQRAIASFLDRETGRIDRLVAKKRELIERLKEKRTALISRTITRGLPPAAARAAGLPANPPFKPSGIEWLGEIPEHWEVKAIKWESPVKRGASPRPIDDERFFDDQGEYAWVRIADVTAAGPFLEKTEQQMSPLGSSLSVKLKPGALFLSIAGTVGKPCITTIKCCIHDGFVYFPSWKGDTKFLFYIFASGEPYKGLGKMGTQLNLNTDTVGSIKIGLPPRREQSAIAAYLDFETAKLDALVGKVAEAVERLQEYRTALITAAVTGKIDVRNEIQA